jgi:hypothetical protein
LNIEKLEQYFKYKTEIINWNDFFSFNKDLNLEILSWSVYKKRNYSAQDLKNYKNNTKHLSNYNYDKNWYSFSLSNLLWYKLINWKIINTKLLEKYNNRIKYLSKISTNRKNLELEIDNLIKEKKIIVNSQNLEPKLLEYLLKVKNIKEKDFDLLIAYQLLWKFEEFTAWSNDKKNMFTDPETLHMIQINALLEEYWDSLKETIKKLEETTLESKDKKLFDSYLRKTPKEVKDLSKDRIINWMIESFKDRPINAINSKIIQKSIEKKLEVVLQLTDISEREKSDFAKEFNVEDLLFKDNENFQDIFKEKWRKKAEEYFWKIDKVWLDIRSIKENQADTYNELQTESNKFEAITDKEWKKSDRKVLARFWKTKYDALARWVGDICIWNNSEMWENTDYFELVLFDKDRELCIWTVMLLNMQEENWDKYLLFWPNPSVEFNDKVSSEKLYEKIANIIKNFAKDNNYSWVLFNPQHWLATNRTWTFQKTLEDSQLKDKKWKIIKISLEKEYSLANWYNYQKNLSVLWQNEEKWNLLSKIIEKIIH